MNWARRELTQAKRTGIINLEDSPFKEKLKVFDQIEFVAAESGQKEYWEITKLKGTMAWVQRVK